MGTMETDHAQERDLALALDPGPGPFELLSARCLIEPALAAMAARVASDSAVAAILAAAAAMARTIAQLGAGDDSDTARAACACADEHFHLTLARAAGNAALLSALEHLWRRHGGGLCHTLALLCASSAQRHATQADYVRIGDAIAARDPGAARLAMRTHLRRYVGTLARG